MKSTHTIKIGNRKYEGDPATVGMLYVLFGTVYSIDVTSNVTISAEKPTTFIAGLARSATTPTCSITDTDIQGDIIYTAVPAFYKTADGVELKFTTTTEAEMTFNQVFVYAQYSDGRRVLIYRGCHTSDITVSPGETLEVSIQFRIA
jgi:hypothetical protein